MDLCGGIAEWSMAVVLKPKRPICRIDDFLA
jgi:hypothetical protein